MANEIEVEAISGPMVLGEGPHWNESDNSLIFTNIFEGYVNRYYPESKRMQVLDIDPGSSSQSMPSFIIPIKDSNNHFAIGDGHDIGIVEWKTTEPDRSSKKISKLLSLEQNIPGNRFNDAKVDPQGRLWAGTMGCQADLKLIKNETATLYRIDSDLKTSEMVKEVSISNGMAWNQGRDTFYYIDSIPKLIEAFDYNDGSGELEARRTVVDFEKAGLKDDIPDGMTIDNVGNLWVASFGGARILCIDPNVGKILRTVKIPSRYVTSCCFGGRDFSTLFVTSATAGNLSKEELSLLPDSGKTFAITGLGVKGSAAEMFKMDLNLLECN